MTTLYNFHYFLSEQIINNEIPLLIKLTQANINYKPHSSVMYAFFICPQRNMATIQIVNYYYSIRGFIMTVIFFVWQGFRVGTTLSILLEKYPLLLLPILYCHSPRMLPLYEGIGKITQLCTKQTYKCECTKQNYACHEWYGCT